MKLPDYAKHLGISYKTAWRWWKDGKLPHPAFATKKSLLVASDYDILIVEHKDRLAGFGTNYLGVFLTRCGIRLEIVNRAENGRDELRQDWR